LVYRTVYPLCWSPWIGWIPDPVTPPLAPLAAWSHGRSWQLRQQNRTSRPGRRSPWYRPTSKYLEMLHWSTDIYSGCEVWIYFSARFSESLVSLMHNLENLPSFICFCWRYNLTVSWCWLQLQIIEFSLVNIHTIGHSEYSDSEWILNFKKIVHFSPILAKSGRCKLLALRCSEPWHLTIPCRPRSSKQPICGVRSREPEDNDERHEAAETYRSDLTNINWGRIRKIHRLIVGISTIWMTEIIWNYHKRRQP